MYVEVVTTPLLISLWSYQVPDLDGVIASISGGGLLSGLAIGAKVCPAYPHLRAFNSRI